MPENFILQKYRRHDFISGIVPNDLAVKNSGSPILIVVCSVVVKKNLLLVDVKGYSAGGATWTIHYFSIKGDTATFNGPWNLLNDFINNKTYVGTDGKRYNIAITLIESGCNTEWVYAYQMRHGQGVYACKEQEYIDGGEIFKLFKQSTLKNIGLSQAFHINIGKLKDNINNAFMLQWNEHEYQPDWYPNFSTNIEDDYLSTSSSDGFISYCINLAALEIWANDWCRRVLELEALDWSAFWESAKKGYFFDNLEISRIELTLIELQTSLENHKEKSAVETETEKEPFLRGVHYGYTEGLNRAISIILEMRERLKLEAANA